MENLIWFDFIVCLTVLLYFKHLKINHAHEVIYIYYFYLQEKKQNENVAIIQMTITPFQKEL